VYKDDKILITRRKPDGLLGGLWEFPGGKIQEHETAQQACIREIREETGLEVNIGSFLTRIRHAYTHFKIVMDVFCCRYAGGNVILRGAVDYRWINFEDIDKYPFPKANHKFIPLIPPAISRIGIISDKR
jgi:A/G-specific adenine glycosylase